MKLNLRTWYKFLVFQQIDHRKSSQNARRQRSWNRGTLREAKTKRRPDCSKREDYYGDKQLLLVIVSLNDLLI